MIRRANRAPWRGLAGLALLALLLSAALPALARDWPKPAGPLADHAQVVEPAWQPKIVAAAQQIRQQTGLAVVIATVPSLDREPLETAAARLLKTWGIGQRGADKGALILVATAQRRVHLAVGPSLEGSLTAARAPQIRDQVVVPYLKEGRYGQGLYEGLLALGHTAATQAKVKLEGLPQVKVAYKDESPYGSWGMWGGVILLVVVYLVARARRARQGRGQG